jgi:hypothetical protein
MKRSTYPPANIYSEILPSQIRLVDSSDHNEFLKLSRDFCDYRQILDWRPDLLDSERVTTYYWPLLHTHTNVHSHIFTSRCLVATFNGGHFPSFGFPKVLRPHLPILTNLYHLGTDRKENFVPLLLFTGCYLVAAVK